WSSGHSSSRSSASSTRPRSSSGLCIALGLPLGALELVLYRLRQLGELAQDLERTLGRGVLVGREPVEPGSRGLEPRQQLLGPIEGILRAHAAISRTIRPSIPFTRRPASSEA